MQILKSGERAAGLIRQLLFFSHKMEGKRCSIDVNQEVRKTIHIELMLDSHLWAITQDREQLSKFICRPMTMKK